MRCEEHGSGGVLQGAGYEGNKCCLERAWVFAEPKDQCGLSSEGEGGQVT